MIGENWRSVDFWRWWWRHRAPGELKVGLGVATVALVLVAGYFAADRLTGTSEASTGLATYAYDTTVQRMVTVREHGRVVVKRVPIVVRRLVVRPVTSFKTVVDTRVIKTPGGTKIVKRKVTRYVPVVRKKIVTRNGKTTTVTETKLVPTVQTQTQVQVVTNQQTVVNNDTVVVTTTRNETVTQPETVVQTVTAPPDTVTVTNTETQTVTQTETVVETVTQPADTVTVTVPAQ
jgi:hypothetical protein